MYALDGISSLTMFFFEWGNEGKVWESRTSYAIIRVITVRVMRSLLYIAPRGMELCDNSSYNRSSWELDLKQFCRFKSGNP